MLADDILDGVKAAAAHCGLGRRRLQYLVEKKAVPHKRVGRALFFRRSELDAFFRSDAL